jgi:microcystin-dependent protein
MPGQQIQKGTTYVNYGTPGVSQVTAENLNDHVDNAVLLPGAISGQTETTAQISDYVMSERGGSLFKYTLSSIRDLFATYFPLRSGATMTGELTLSSSTPSGNSVAASKGYVDTVGAAATAAATLPGAIVMWGGPAAPSGWLECNGQSTTGYPNLISIYGATLPDLRGEFVRGWDHGRDVDAGRAILSTQEQDIQPHTHLSNSVGLVGTKTINWYGTFPSAYSNNNVTQTGSAGGTETRPRNVALMYIVKT